MVALVWIWRSTIIKMSSLLLSDRCVRRFPVVADVLGKSCIVWHCKAFNFWSCLLPPHPTSMNNSKCFMCNQQRYGDAADTSTSSFLVSGCVSPSPAILKRFLQFLTVPLVLSTTMTEKVDLPTCCSNALLLLSVCSHTTSLPTTW